ncbi:MAG: DMT family transporter [Lancefieldella parvula]|uniref:DMT family transporter n=1 Tax=Lancefieldella parvula TaxID=1382 RepID=A0A9E7APX9_9ACTN|nr:MAG: DMT family transporter [Lancefieldella parvula]
MDLPFEAYHLVGVGIATLEYYCGPVIVMALSPLLFGEKLTAKKILGFLVVVIGAALIIGYGVGLNLSPVGLLLGALSAVLYAVMVICNRQLKDVSGIEGTSIQLGIGCAVVALVTVVFHGIELPADPASVNWLSRSDHRSL